MKCFEWIIGHRASLAFLNSRWKKNHKENLPDCLARSNSIS